ncbi:MAG: DUF58 domain-containing protein [Fulvimonas sp.]|nr:DUF58 domain-containing protein [Fulvimonas sp.]
MHAALQRLARLAERRLPALTRLREPELLPIELDRRRIYIVPTGFGLGFGVLLLVMLLGALNYANNAALLLTCLLGAAAAASMLVAFRNLDGLRLETLSFAQVAAGEPLSFTLGFAASRPRQAIVVSAGTAQLAFSLDRRADITLSWPTERRGWLELPPLRVSTTWPLGLFRAWSWLRPAPAALIWPRAEAAGPPPPGTHDAPRRQSEGEDTLQLRPYRHGDPLRRVAWKASARHDAWLVRDLEPPRTIEDWRLDWYALAGLDPEARIARLARWINEAHAGGWRFGLRLPAETIEPGSGDAHYARCMSALALLP